MATNMPICVHCLPIRSDSGHFVNKGHHLFQFPGYSCHNVCFNEYGGREEVAIKKKYYLSIIGNLKEKTTTMMVIIKNNR